MRRIILSVAFLLCAGTLTAQQFSPTAKPISPDGTAAIVDLPTSQHMRNVGGSDGSGLCVFTSLQHAAYWQNVRTLDGFRAWMQQRPGGGWPGKVDQMSAQFCKEKGAAVPPYIQHTGGDNTFLELALKTDRVPCVTYDGRDDFYRDRFGRPAQIAHMVNLAHLDASRAAIIDNNRPGYWVWMSRADFLSRWRGNGGGWAVVLLAPPPPPHPPAQAAKACICGDSCKCKEGECPKKCPVAKKGCDCCKPSCTCEPPGKLDTDCLCYPCQCGKPVKKFEQQCPSCPNGRCPLVQPSMPDACPDGRCPLAPSPAIVPGLYDGPVPFGEPPDARYEWRKWDDGPGYGWRLKLAPEAVGAVENFGVSKDKIHTHPEYSVCGKAITKAHAHALLSANGLSDDSDRWHLTAVGDDSFTARFLADVAALPADVRGKLLVQAYAPDHWAVPLYSLPVGVSLRKPSPVRTSGTVGTLPTVYTLSDLDMLLAREGGPTWKPAPNVDPKPPEPVKPAPTPPAPGGDSSVPLCCLAALALVIYFLRRPPSNPQTT